MNQNGQKQWGAGFQQRQQPQVNQSQGQGQFSGGFAQQQSLNNATKYGKNKGKGGGKKFLLFIFLIVLIVGGLFVYKKYFSNDLNDNEYTQTAKFSYDKMKSLWGTTDDAFDEVVKKAWIPQELAYFNGNEARTDFYNYILNHVNFITEKEKQKDKKGNEIEVEETLNNVKTVKVEIPDYKALQYRVEYLDYDAIKKGYEIAGLDKKDYNYEDKMIDFFISYITTFKKLPTKVVTVKMPNELKSNYKELLKKGQPLYLIETDAALDTTLFASEEFHDLETVFAAVANGDIGELKDNPEYGVWQKKKEQYEKANASKIVGSTTDKKTEAVEGVKADENAGNVVKTEEKETQKEETEAAEAVEDLVEGKDKEKSLKELLEDKKSLAGAFNSVLIYNQVDNKFEEAEPSRKTLNIPSETEGQPTEGQEGQTQSQPAEGQGKEGQSQGQPAEGKNQEVEADKVELGIDGSKLTEQEKAIGLEPPKQIFTREQVENPEWIQWSQLPQKQKEQIVEPVKTINKALVNEVSIPFTWIGAYYLQHNYVNSEGKKVVIKPQRGTGTYKNPAAIGTIVQGKAEGKDGKDHDVKVKLTRILTEAEAIKYAMDFDNRNRGFDNRVSSKLVVIEFELTNLEEQENELVSAFTLSDQYGNEVPRNGEMYSFRTSYKFKPKETVLMQDWFYAEDINNRYLTWSKGFNKKYPILWFDVLAYQNKDKNTEAEETEASSTIEKSTEESTE